MADSKSTATPGELAAPVSPFAVANAVGWLGACSDSFGHLAAILKAIKQATDKHSDAHRLAGAGWYLARDTENAADCWREDLEEAAKGERPAVTRTT